MSIPCFVLSRTIPLSSFVERYIKKRVNLGLIRYMDRIKKISLVVEHMDKNTNRCRISIDHDKGNLELTDSGFSLLHLTDRIIARAHSLLWRNMNQPAQVDKEGFVRVKL